MTSEDEEDDEEVSSSPSPSWISRVNLAAKAARLHVAAAQFREEIKEEPTEQE